jgi:hypothetical protein
MDQPDPAADHANTHLIHRLHQSICAKTTRHPGALHAEESNDFQATATHLLRIVTICAARQ